MPSAIIHYFQGLWTDSGGSRAFCPKNSRLWPGAALRQQALVQRRLASLLRQIHTYEVKDTPQISCWQPDLQTDHLRMRHFRGHRKRHIIILAHAGRTSDFHLPVTRASCFTPGTPSGQRKSGVASLRGITTMVPAMAWRLPALRSSITVNCRAN